VIALRVCLKAVDRVKVMNTRLWSKGIVIRD